MKITIETIPHGDQRYPTPGDWMLMVNGDIEITVSEEVGDWRSQILVAVHELVELCACRQNGITQAQVDSFDLEFEKNRTNPVDEPGDSAQAPYRHEHSLATGVERILAAELKVDWQPYVERVESLSLCPAHA